MWFTWPGLSLPPCNDVSTMRDHGEEEEKIGEGIARDGQDVIVVVIIIIIISVVAVSAKITQAVAVVAGSGGWRCYGGGW